MTEPFELLLWVIAGAVSLVIAGVAVAITVVLIRGALVATLRKDRP